MKTRKAVGLGLVALLIGTLGCTAERRLPDRIDVTGKVTLGGEPLPAGSISFSSEKDIADGMVASADIKDGQYAAKVPLGEKKVVIHSIIQTSDPAHEFMDLIPVQYNKKSTLTADVSVGNSEFDFHLTK
ncbi:hypothetical protein [Blastopirellula marina]|uniref:Carboxypeptidase regulatory-like domain-containing protein n=1 Tax=Blastopirellula marina DSM 3645 TaxID=314230 RepID=A4A095_9BACT|nr:hypothetical protein [Blastopirellula marina]EAQ77881.1 hypothetical protein DSM3645_06254 [Blastopirellula marina DSM 3645]